MLTIPSKIFLLSCHLAILFEGMTAILLSINFELGLNAINSSHSAMVIGRIETRSAKRLTDIAAATVDANRQTIAQIFEICVFAIGVLNFF